MVPLCDAGPNLVNHEHLPLNAKRLLISETHQLVLQKAAHFEVLPLPYCYTDVPLPGTGWRFFARAAEIIVKIACSPTAIDNFTADLVVNLLTTIIVVGSVCGQPF
jgi:hypothetical protein